MSLIRFLDAPHDLMFVKGIIFKNVDPEKHRKCSAHQKCPKIRCLQAFSLIQSRQRTSQQDTVKTINLHTPNNLPLSDKVMSVQSTSFVPFKKLLNFTDLNVPSFLLYNMFKGRRCCL